MQFSRSDRWRALLVLTGMGAFLLGSGLFIVNRLQLTVDLAYFLPEPQTLAQELLTERLGQGPGSRLMFISLADQTGARDDDLTMVLSEELMATGLFTFVSDGSVPPGIAAIPAAVFENRYLLADVTLETDQLEQTLRSRLGDLAAIADADFIALVAADPSLASIAVLEKLAGPATVSAAGSVSAESDVIHLLAETIAPSFDAEAQQQAVEQVLDIVLDRAGRLPELHGAGVYTAELQAFVRADAGYRSAVATLLIVLILLALYRRWLVVPLSLLPVIMGGVAGMLALTLAYGQIHGITLAFGFTLLGVAIDYPLHLLSHARSTAAALALRDIWPTLRLGALTTAIAYTALGFGGSQGLAQLGMFSAVGVLVALATVRWVMPLLITVSGYSNAQPAVSNETDSIAATAFPAKVQSHVAWLVVLGAAIILLGIARPALWESDLATLVPVSKERLQRDRELRDALGAPEMGYLLAVSGDSYEDVLERTEQLEPLVGRAREAGFLAGATLATTLLPSERSQRQRLEYMHGISDLSQRMETATANMPFSATAFDPFVADVARMVSGGALVNQATWQSTRFGQLASFSVYETDEQWVSQSMLYGLTDPPRMQELLTALPGTSLVDLRGASIALVDAYRQRILSMLALTSLLALLLLWWRIGLGRRMLWVAGSIAAALSLTVVLKAWLFGGLSLFALMACVLVAGLGLDYGLFCSRTSVGDASAAATAHAVRACALSTFAAFAVLAFSPIPVLQDIGFTVATGVALTFLLMLTGRGRLTESSG